MALAFFFFVVFIIIIFAFLFLLNALVEVEDPLAELFLFIISSYI